MMKKALRKNAMHSLMSNDVVAINQTFTKAFSSLIQYPECLDQFLADIQKPKPIQKLLSICDIMNDNVQLIKKYDSEKPNMFSKDFFNSIDIQISNAQKQIDGQVIDLFEKAGKLLSNLSYEISTPPINSNQTALIFFTSSYSGNDNLVQNFESAFKAKLTLNYISIGYLYFLAKVKNEKYLINTKHILSLYKGLAEHEIFPKVLPILLSVAKNFLLDSIRDLLPIFMKRMDAENLPHFTDYLLSSIDKYKSIIQPNSTDILNIYMTVINNKAEIDSEIADPLTSVPKETLESFCKLADLFGIDLVNQYFITQVQQYTKAILLVLFFITKNFDKEFFAGAHFDSLLESLGAAVGGDQSLMQLLILTAGFFVSAFESKQGLIILVKGLQRGARQACNWLCSEALPFETVFPALVDAFEPGKASDLFMSTLVGMLNINNTPEADDYEDPPSVSDSNLDAIRGIILNTQHDQVDDQLLQGVPAPSTILFCKVISSFDSLPQLAPLLLPAAGAVSAQFASEFNRCYSRQRRRRSNIELVTSYSNAAQCLDRATLYSFAQTFLLLSPGPAMLFLAVSLQRLPPTTVTSMLQRTTAFAPTDPDTFGRMVALVFHSHPETALSFVSNYIDSTILRRRVFLFFRSSEVSEPAAIAAFRALGYSSNFTEPSFFVSDFLPFTSRFLNKHLTHTTKNSGVYASALFCIRKLSQRLLLHQEQFPEHVFPFKDFLVQFVCAYYLDLCDVLFSSDLNQPQPTENLLMVPQILNALSALLPLQPVRAGDRHARTIELTSALLESLPESSIPVIIKAAETFFESLIKSNQSILVFIEILQSLFKSLIRSPAPPLHLEMLLTIAKMWSSVKIAQGGSFLSQAISKTASFLACVLPFVEGECGTLATDIVMEVCSMQSAIRNHILSLPPSIAPSRPTVTDDKERTKTVVQFVSRNLLTSQCFDILTEIIENIHSKAAGYGGALVCLYIIQERGGEEFRHDAKIIGALLGCAKIHEDKETREVILKCICAFADIRFYSVVTCVLAENPSPEILKALLQVMVTIEGSDSSLIGILAGSYENPLPLLVSAVVHSLTKAISNAPDDTYAKLYLCLLKTSDEKDEDYENFFGAKKETLGEYFELAASNNHEGALLLIPELIPDDDKKAHILASLAFASCRVCEAALKKLLLMDSSQISNRELKVLSKALGKFDVESCADGVISLVVPRYAEDGALECIDNFLGNFEPCSQRKMLSAVCQEIKGKSDKLPDLLGIIQRRITKQNASSIVTIVPELILRAKSAHVVEVLKAVSGFADNVEHRDLVGRVLCAGLFDNAALLKAFVDVLKESKNGRTKEDRGMISASIAAISLLCESVDGDNAYAIEAVIDEVCLIDTDEENCSMSVLQDLILQ